MVVPGFAGDCLLLTITQRMLAATKAPTSPANTVTPDVVLIRRHIPTSRTTAPTKNKRNLLFDFFFSIVLGSEIICSPFRRDDEEALTRNRDILDVKN
ncbi:hypothetical protein ACFL2D_01210 [Patescibacteria group bacterium]